MQIIRKSSLIQKHSTLTSEDIKLTTEIKLMFNSNEINLPKLVMIEIKDNIRVRRMISKEMQNFHIMVKQGMTWYNLESV